jgi:hypothetical protein
MTAVTLSTPLLTPVSWGYARNGKNYPRLPSAMTASHPPSLLPRGEGYARNGRNYPRHLLTLTVPWGRL